MYASLADLPTSVDMADIFRDAASLPEVTQDVVAAGIPAMWTQLGVVHVDAERTALDASLNLVVDRCPAIEIPATARRGLSTPSPIARLDASCGHYLIPNTSLLITSCQRLPTAADYGPIQA